MPFIRCALVSLCLASVAATAAAETVLLDETFPDDPVANGRATVSGDASRITFAPGSATAAYNTDLPTTKLLFDIGTTLDQSTPFAFEADMTIHSAGFAANPMNFAQLAFGLINSATTGDDRAGGGPSFGDAFDIVTFDYFPNVSMDFGGPTLGPTVVETATGSGFFADIRFPFGAETDLTAEGPLPLDTLLHARVDYDAAVRTLTLSVTSAAMGLDINSDGGGGLVGGADGELMTIQSVLPNTAAFSVDRFALLLWEDTFPFDLSSPSVVADVTYERVRVTTPAMAIPEPTTLLLLAAPAAIGLLRRRAQGGPSA